jgi:hypothetical protein
LVPFGDDFKYKVCNKLHMSLNVNDRAQRAGLQFTNIEKLMAEINANPAKYGVRMRYSIVEDYFDDVFRDATEVWRLLYS